MRSLVEHRLHEVCIHVCKQRLEQRHRLPPLLLLLLPSAHDTYARHSIMVLASQHRNPHLNLAPLAHEVVRRELPRRLRPCQVRPHQPLNRRPTLSPTLNTSGLCFSNPST